MDDEHLPPLGPGKAWLVKDFPVSLREEITRAAAGQGVTVGAWLVAHFQKHGIGGVEITRAYPTVVNSGNLSAGTAVAVLPARPEIEDLGRLVQMAQSLSGDDKDTTLVKLARTVVRERLRALRGAST